MSQYNVQYKKSSFVPIISDSEIVKEYKLVRDMDPDQRPRERLIKNGALSLSTPELFAVVLNTGTKKEDVLAMASRITREYGENGIISERDPERLSKDLKIPLIRATQIVAIMELGRRFFQPSKGSQKVIRTAKDVYDYTKGMHDLPKEHLRGIYLNSHYRVIHDEVVSIGTIDASIIHPREVFRPALEYGAAAVILVHNHPSGVLKPSAADVVVTNQLIEAGKLVGIELIDHVIVSAKGYVSIM